VTVFFLFSRLIYFRTAVLKFINNKLNSVFSMQRCIVHEGPKRVADYQNYKDKDLKSLLEIMGRVLYKPSSYASMWIGKLCSGVGRSVLPW
jgi:hypothetical protein